MTKTKFKFSIFGLSHRPNKGSEVMVGSEDLLYFFLFLNGIFVQTGLSGTNFDHGQFEIRTFLTYTPPYCANLNATLIKHLYSGAKCWFPNFLYPSVHFCLLVNTTD